MSTLFNSKTWYNITICASYEGMDIMNNYGDLNPSVNKTPPDPHKLLPGQVKINGRKSTANEKTRAEKSLNDQRAYCEATCRQHSLRFSEEDWMPEPPGYSGALWWEGGGTNGLEQLDQSRKTRPVLTKIMRGIVAGEIRCLVVYSLDRLWRDVAICRGILNLLFKFDCLLYDVNGPVNIWTYEGRNAILQNAIASQAVSEAARVNSPRGVQQNIKEGKLVVSPNVQGFRTAGPRTCEVRHLDCEQELVNRIYQMADRGASPEDICCTLMAEGISLYQGTGGRNPHGHKRDDANLFRIYNDQILSILRDCRYVGRQQHIPSHVRDEARASGIKLDPRDHQYPCPAFLRPDATTVVPIELWERVQAKLDLRRRTSNRSVNYRPLASLVRCGIDGESLNAQENKMKDGSKVGFWIMRHTKILGKGCVCACTHRVPTVREDTLNSYIADIFCPLLVAEINERHSNSVVDGDAARRANLEREQDKAMRWHKEGLIQYAKSGQISPMLLAGMEADALSDIERLRREIATLRVDENIIPKLIPTLMDLNSASHGAKRDALRQCLCWVAVFDTPSEREPKPNYTAQAMDQTNKYTYAPRIVGKFVFLTSWGTYHTAVLCRERDSINSGYPPFILRPATPEEMIGGVADFPDPDTFIAGLKRAWAGRVYGWSPDKIAPGYSPRQEMPVAEFIVNEGSGLMR